MLSLEKQKEKIADFYSRHKRLPSYSEMMVLFNYKSKNAVHRVVQKMVDAGILAKDERGRLSPENLLGGARLLGVVEAGFPSPAEEELADTMSLDEFMIQKPEATFLLKVKGDSMIDAGIMEGDLVLVERTENARVSDIVIADVDGEYTMKYLRKKGRSFYLEAANQSYPDMYPEGELKVAAVVKGVLRKY